MEKMLKKKPSPPSFCRLLFNDFTHSLEIPCDFVKKHMMKGGELVKRHILKTHGCSNSKSWDVKMNEISENYFFKKGWSDFVKDNNLEKGDTLLFFWRRRPHSTFLVTIFDPTACIKNISTPSSPLEEQPCENEMNVKAEEDTDGVKTRNPWCVVTITRSTFYRLHLSKSFVKKTGVLLKENHTVLRNEEGRKWRVKTLLRSNGSIFNLTDGWKDFRDENGIKESDVCSFEFCRDEGNLIDVRVIDKKYKKTTSAEKRTIRDPTSCIKNIYVPSSPLKEQPCENERIVEAEEDTDGVKTKNPCCVVIITKKTLYRQHLSQSFVKEAGVLVKENHTVLRNEDGRKWRVETLLRRNGYMFELAGGWRDFTDENGIKESDVCSFEFCRDEGNLIDVRVIDKKYKKTTSAKKHKKILRERKTTHNKGKNLTS